MTQEVLKLALDALTIMRGQLKSWGLGDEAITAIKGALAQPQQGASLTMQDIVCPMCGDMARTWPKKENT